MAGSGLTRQVATAGAGAIAHAAGSTKPAHHPAAREARRKNPELHMRKSKVRVSRRPFDTECHGFTFPHDMGGHAAGVRPPVGPIVTGFAGQTAAMWPPGEAANSDFPACRRHIKGDCPPTTN